MSEKETDTQPANDHLREKRRATITVLGAVTIGVTFSTSSAMPAHAAPSFPLELNRSARAAVVPYEMQRPSAKAAVLGLDWARNALANFMEPKKEPEVLEPSSPNVVDKARGSTLVINDTAQLEGQSDSRYHKKNDSFRKKLNLVDLIEQAKGSSLSQKAVSQKTKPASISELAEQIRAKSAEKGEAIKNRIETPVFTFGAPIVIEVKAPEAVDSIDSEPSDIEVIEATEPIITEDEAAAEGTLIPKTLPVPIEPNETEGKQTPAAETAPDNSHSAEREKKIKSLHDKTLQFSWKKGSSIKVEMVPEYAKLVKKMQKEGLYVGGIEHPGVDCGAYVTILMRESGIDPKYNYSGKGGNTTTQEKYLKQSPDWRAVGQVREGGVSPERPASRRCCYAHWSR